MANWLLKLIMGNRNKRVVRRLRPLVAKVNALEEQYQKLSDDEIKAKTAEFKERLAQGETLDDLMIEAFAVIKNVCRRLCGQSWEVCGTPYVWNMIPYDVQILGGIVLHRGAIAEMATGEGKTLVSIFPIYLNALTGRGVHVVTVNDYLARRDSQWNKGVFDFLGITIGCIQNQMDPAERRIQYGCDVTYGTNSEFGFDYLRDNGMAMRKEEMVQRGHYYAIIDEVDSILIDEARTPLIISGPVGVSKENNYQEIKGMVQNLVNKQLVMCNDMLHEAKELLKTGDENDRYKAGRLMYIVRKGNPKNHLLTKMMEDPDNHKLLERIHADLIADMKRKEMHKITEDLYFAMDEKSNEVFLTDKGLATLSPEDQSKFILQDPVEETMKIDEDESLTAEEKIIKKENFQRIYHDTSERLHNLSQLMRAYVLFEKDVNYVVQEGKVLIVDEFTGRIMPGRRYSDGLHSALEAKENVKIEGESQTYATITIQNYFRLYEKLAGMTGTAETEAEEFQQIYHLDVVSIPTNKPVQRKDLNDVVYKTRREKYNAVIRDISRCYEKGQPVLVGTVTVDQSEVLSRMLQRLKIPHSVLNAKYHEREAEIVAQAGQKGSVTIATNMAGRGTDIKLGPGVAELGGLHIIGTERHESRRIDRQLRGRSGRQGDPGSSRFYVSLEDDLMRLFGSDKIATLMEKMGMQENEELQHPLLNRSIETAQKRVEQRNFGIRKHTLEFDDVMNKQRAVIYEFRTHLLMTDDIRDDALQFLDDAVGNFVDDFMVIQGEFKEVTASMVNQFFDKVCKLFPVDIQRKDVEKLMKNPVELQHYLRDAVWATYRRKVQAEGEEYASWLEHIIFLVTIDRFWKDHLYEMDGLRESVYLRSYGQKDPLLEYKKEAHHIFTTMMESLAGEVAKALLFGWKDPKEIRNTTMDMDNATYSYSDVSSNASSAPNIQFSEDSMHMSDVAYSGAGGALKQKTVVRTQPKVGRNDPCPCGSGKKYKNCCGQ